MLRNNREEVRGCLLIQRWCGKTDISSEDLAINIASSGYYEYVLSSFFFKFFFLGGGGVNAEK